MKADPQVKEWEREERKGGHYHARNTLTLGAQGVRIRRDWSGSVQISEVRLEEFIEGCVQDTVTERFGRDLLNEVIAEAKRLLAAQPHAATGSWRRLLSPDRAFEIRHEYEPGPRDDFYGTAEHYWRVVHRPSGKVVVKFEGGDYGNRWTGIRDVRFSDDGRALIVTSGDKEERFDLPAAPGAAGA